MRIANHLAISSSEEHMYTYTTWCLFIIIICVHFFIINNFSVRSLMYGFETLILHSREVYRPTIFIGITMVVSLSFIFCNYELFSNTVSDFGHFLHLCAKKKYCIDTAREYTRIHNL